MGRKKPRYPKNLCSLFWGSVLGAPLCWFFTILWALIVLLFWAIVYAVVLLVGAVGFLFGFVFTLSGEYPELFHPYRFYGKRDEKRMPVAPWHIWLPALLIWLFVMKDFLIAKSIAKLFVWLFGQIIWVPTHSVGLMILGGIVGIVLLVLFFRSTPWKICWEFAKATKKKMCPLIVIETKDYR